MEENQQNELEHCYKLNSWWMETCCAEGQSPLLELQGGQTPGPVSAALDTFPASGSPWLAVAWAWRLFLCLFLLPPIYSPLIPLPYPYSLTSPLHLYTAKLTWTAKRVDELMDNI